MKILYIGPDQRGANGTSWRDAFLELGHEVETLDDGAFDPVPRTLIGKWVRKKRRRPTSDHVQRLNEQVERAVASLRPNLIFFVKAYHITPDTLERVRKQAPCFAWMNDDMFNPANQTPTFHDNVRIFDVILTTKSFNVREYYAAGASCPIYIPNSYDPHIHFPAHVTETDRQQMGGDIAFIGMFRKERADYLNVIARRREFRLNIWGGGWGKMRRIDHLHKRLEWRTLQPCVHPHELWCEDMGKAIQANAITLGLLYQDNRDLQTCRSFEIPACGGFMLAERTEEHRMFFEEDKEAVYFSSLDELISKARFYLGHSEIRNRIAQAGYRRCLASPYRIIDRARDALELVEKCSPRHSVAS